MTPPARLQAAAEILDAVIASTRDDGPPADAIVTRYFKTRRYAGSKDRRAVRELVFRAIRRSAERPDSGRAAMLGLIDEDPALEELLGQARGPEPRAEGEKSAAAGLVPSWLEQEIDPLVATEEWPALLERAPLDLRVNVARTDRDAMLAAFPGAEPTPLSPWGIRVPSDTRVDESRAYLDGLVEVQDEGSQLIALACELAEGERAIDLCAGAGGKALALAAAAPGAHILATDSNRQRLSRLPARAERAGARIETRLINPHKELEALDEYVAKADLVLVDAPCSGSGTWRRNPEGRWRLTPDRLDRVTALQQLLLDLGAELVRPGGRLVYATCSILSREGAGAIDAFQSRRSSWMKDEPLIMAGRPSGEGRLLSPGHDGTDGFFIARLSRPC
ncbi:MAG: RsmB/NOP family class I SAM-dependent RNA methyltransferase [Sphingomicrobium sp.]